MSNFDNESKTLEEMMLPEGMNFNVKQTLSHSHKVDELTFRTCLIKNLKDELGNVVPDLIQPRYVHLYSENGSDVREAERIVRKILGDAFEYEFSKSDCLPLSENKVGGEPNKISLLGHYRSRCLNARKVIDQFETMQTSEVISQLLKSTYGVHVTHISVAGNNSYTAIGTFLPRTADLMINSGTFSHSSPVTALEKLLKNELAPYNKIIDLNFDTVVVKFNEFEGEFEAPLSADAFIDFFTKNILSHAILMKSEAKQDFKR